MRNSPRPGVPLVAIYWAELLQMQIEDRVEISFGDQPVLFTPDFRVASYPFTRRTEKGLRRQASSKAGTASCRTRLPSQYSLNRRTKQKATNRPLDPTRSSGGWSPARTVRDISYALMDGNLTQGFGPLTQVGVTDRVPASNTGTKDNADRPMRLDPPESGSISCFLH